MQEIRHQFVEELRGLEARALGGAELVVVQLDRAMAALSGSDVELAATVVADDDPIDDRYLEVHQGVLSLLARQAPVATDLRIVASLLHVIRSIERMGDQCVNIAKLVPLSGHEARHDPRTLAAIEQMGTLARGQIVRAGEAFSLRDVERAQRLAERDREINRLNREVFARAVDVGDDPDLREWAMFMVLVARCLERIGDYAVDVAEQVVFVVTGMLEELETSPSVTD